ncbi:MAG: cyclic nucleotide-binding domain-containing protein [Fibrobacter sp.]|jgi:CRP-like cAMP-binding protein|nr:cyclic nucleotide-binding domain-containing protein [Fibrobacter sp.]
MKSHASIADWISASYERKIPFLDQIPTDARDYFLLNSEIREYDAGDVIIWADKPAEYFCVLQSGYAQICGRATATGHCSALTVLEPGECFGDLSLICNEPAPSAVIAVEDGTTVLCLPGEDFIRFLDKNPKLLVIFYKMIAARLQVKNLAFDDFSGLDVIASARVLPFIDLAQTLEKSYITGTVIFENGDESGFIAFKDGRICCAKSGSYLGAEALEYLLSWDENTRFKLNTQLLPDVINISQESDTTSLILDALRNIDEKRSESPS